MSFGKAELKNPEGVAVDTSGNSYVLDQQANKVLKFNAEGKLAEFWALGSTSLDGEDTPAKSFSFEGLGAQLAIDRSAGPNAGNLYVTDSFHQVVDVFVAESGEYLGQLTEANGAPFGDPCGVAVDEEGTVYVSDYYGGISRFTPSANPPVNGDYDGMIAAPNSCQLAVDDDGQGYSVPWAGGTLNRYPATAFEGGDAPTEVTSYAQAIAVDAASGDVYAAGTEEVLPDLVADLKGQIDVELVGFVDSKDGGIRTRFQNVPDAPVSKFVLEMKGGKKSLLVSSVNLCKSDNRATVKSDGQNGKVHDFKPQLKVSCGKGK